MAGVGNHESESGIGKSQIIDALLAVVRNLVLLKAQ